MKTLVTLGSLITALYFAPQHGDLVKKKNTMETKSADLAQQVETLRADLDAMKAELQSINGRLNQFGAENRQGQKTNWVEERNRNYQNRLANGAYEQRQAVTVVQPSPIYVLPPSSSNSNNSSFSRSSSTRKNTVIIAAPPLPLIRPQPTPPFNRGATPPPPVGSGSSYPSSKGS
jgi:outer membrane murein-binding lipoprotein Lpp